MLADIINYGIIGISSVFVILSSIFIGTANNFSKVFDK